MCAHLHIMRETYFGHLSFILKVSAILFVLVFTGLIHGLFPCIFQYTVSGKIRHLNGIMEKRIRDE